MKPRRLVLVKSICHMCDQNEMKFQHLVDWNYGWYCCHNSKCQSMLNSITNKYYKENKIIKLYIFNEIFPEINLNINYKVIRSNKNIETDWRFSDIRFSDVINLVDENMVITKEYNGKNNIIIWLVNNNNILKKPIKLKDFIENNNIDITYPEFKNRILDYFDIRIID